MIFSADPNETSIQMKWWKNQPSSKAASACAQILHHGHSRFWPRSASVFWGHFFFPLRASTWNFQGSLNNAKGTFEPKVLLDHPYNPIFWPKMFPGDRKRVNFFCHFCQRRIEPLGKIFQIHKTDNQNRFPCRSYRSLKCEFVCNVCACWMGYCQLVRKCVPHNQHWHRQQHYEHLRTWNNSKIF